MSAGLSKLKDRLSHFRLVVIFQGVLFALAECAKTPVDLVRLWMHEAERVYKDKLVDNADMDAYEKLSKDIIKKSFEVRKIKIQYTVELQWLKH